MLTVGKDAVGWKYACILWATIHSERRRDSAIPLLLVSVIEQ